MAEKLETGYVELTTRGKNKVKRDLNEIGGTFKRTASAASSAATKIAAAFSGAAILAGIKSVADAYMEQERSIMRLDAAYKASGRTTGFAAKQVGLLADQIEATTMFSDDAARAAATMLAPFERLSNYTIRDVIRVSADVATVLGTDLPEAASALGKALNDPEKGLRKLKQMGIVFSDAENEVLKSMMETNKVAEAQAIILQRVEDRFKGAAEAANKGFPRIANEAKKSLEHIQEDVGAFWAGMVSPDGSGKFGLQDLPFAFIGDQAGKDAYRKQVEADARTAQNAAIVAGGKVDEATARRIAGEKALAESGPAQRELDELWWHRAKSRADGEAVSRRRMELQQKIEAAKGVDLPALRAAEQSAISTSERLAGEARARADKQREFAEAVKESERTKAQKAAIASAKEQQDQMEAFNAARKSDFESRQKSLAEQQDQMQAFNEARKAENDRQNDQAGAEFAAQLQFNEELKKMREEAEANKPVFQSQRMGLEAFSDAIIQGAMGKESVAQKQLDEAKKHGKLFEKMNKNMGALDGLNKFGAGAALV